MSILMIRLPDDKHERLKALAKANSISVNRLMDELATVALANYDARVHFETRTARGNCERAGSPSRQARSGWLSAAARLEADLVPSATQELYLRLAHVSGRGYGDLIAAGQGSARATPTAAMAFKSAASLVARGKALRRASSR